MGRPKKEHYSLGQTVVFIWSGTKKLGKIESRSLKGKKMFYDVKGDDGKIYEDLFTDDSTIACILTRETEIVNKSIESKKSEIKS